MENENKEPIPSPFMQELATPSSEDQKFIDEIAAICKEYGYRDFFISFTPADPSHRTARQWKSFSNGLSEDMVQCLEIITKGMRATWEALKKKL